MLNISLVSNIGLKTHSEYTLWVMSTIFFATFCNTQFVLLLSNGNFHNLPKWLPVFHNAYSDFSDGWYKGVAPGIVQAQIFSALFPWIEAASYISFKWLWQILDNSKEFFHRKFGCYSS